MKPCKAKIAIEKDTYGNNRNIIKGQRFQYIYFRQTKNYRIYFKDGTYFSCLADKFKELFTRNYYDHATNKRTS